jgi:hypothetical protein
MGGRGRKGREGRGGKEKRERKREGRGGRGVSPQTQKPNSAYDARTPEEYCRRAVFLQDFAFKFSKIFSELHGGRRV